MINNNIIISNDLTLIDVLGIMDKTNRKLLVVCDGIKFLGVISIGDIQRALLKKQDLTLPVSNYARTIITYAKVSDDLDKVKAKMLSEKIEAMPVVDDNGILCDVIEWNELFTTEESQNNEPVNLPVVIMAGGKGTRLLPLTNVIPKPLIPISDKTIMEEIMSQFKNAGCNQFFVSVNYMMDTIKEYFIHKPEWNIEYIQENKPLGTGGSLYLLKDKVKTQFFVTNCDTLIDINLNDLINYHNSNNNIITIVSAIKTIHIPYGTLDTGVNGIVESMKEKPELVIQINSGFYLLEPEVLNYIDDDKFINLPDIITLLLQNGKKVGAFPVSEGSWIDMGNWTEYLQLVEKYSNK